MSPKKGNFIPFLFRAMSFRTQAKNYFLTYSQCDVPKDALLAFLQSIAPIDEYCIAQEHHEDGNLHLHAFISFKEKFSSRNQRVFDCNGFHPNIQIVRNKKKCIEYCLKEDVDPLTHILTKKDWGVILDESTTQEEFLANVRKSHPREYCLNLERLEYAAKKHFAPKEVEYVPRYTNFINVPLELLTIEIVTNIDRPKSVVIMGSRGLGKTEWARSWGKHVYSRGCVIYDDFLRDVSTATYAVFDDLWEWNFRFLKDFIGGQPTATVTGKYRKPRNIKWGLRSLLLTNEAFWEHYTGKQLEYFRDSTIIIELKNKLF